MVTSFPLILEFCLFCIYSLNLQVWYQELENGSEARLWCCRRLRIEFVF